MLLFEMGIDELTPAEISALSPSRQAHAEQYRFEQDRLLCLAAGVLLDRGLQTFGLRERNVTISRTQAGKPFLPDFPDLHFSLSHSGSRAAAVFSDRPIGCDLERLRPISFPLAQKRFCPEEFAFLQASPQPDLDFCRIWTCKESFFKALGTGLTLPLNCACIALSPESVSLTQSVSASRWCLTEFSRTGYCLAICEECD